MSVTNSIVTNAATSAVSPVDGAGLGRGAELNAPKSLSMSRFEAALERANAGNAAPQSVGQANATTVQPGLESFRTAQLGPQSATTQTAPGGVERTGTSADINAAQSDRTRALRGLDLSKEASSVDQNTTGQGILDGLSKLRGVFDNQEAAITGIADTSLSNSTQLINLQLEVVKYSMLMDVTSKLTGKATQSFDTLMKGQ